MSGKQKAEIKSVEITVRHGGCDSYLARAKGLKITASCTMGPRLAAERCAEKVFGKGRFALNTNGNGRYQAVLTAEVKP